MAAPRTRTLPRATPVSWEADAPTENLPVIAPLPIQRSAPDAEVLPAAAPYGTGPFAASAIPTAGVAGGLAAGTITAVFALIVALTLLGGLLELTGAIPR